jgi:hypothetical protein
MTDETELVEVRPKKTLVEILAGLAEIDNELVEFNPAEHKDLFELKGEKIDAIYECRKNLESRIELQKQLIDEHTAAKKALEGSLERLKQYCVFALQSVHSKREIGVRYHIDLTNHTKVKMKMPEDWITADVYAKYSDVIDRKFSWKKGEIKANIKSYTDIAEIEETHSIKFGVRK